MAKVIREIDGSEEVRALVDGGALADEELKNLTGRDKAFRVNLIEATSGDINPDESSIRIQGDVGVATVTRKESKGLNTSSEIFGSVVEDVNAGHLQGVIEKKLSMRVSGADIEKAVEVLKAAGINVELDVKYELVDVALVGAGAITAGNPERTAAHANLAGAIETKVVHQVKFTMKGTK